MSFKFSPGLKLAKAPRIMDKTWNVEMRPVKIIEAQSFRAIFLFMFSIHYITRTIRNMMHFCLLLEIWGPLFLRNPRVTGLNG